MSQIETQATGGHFESDHLKVDLRRRSLRSAGVTMTSEAVRFALNLAWVAVMARLLAKDDFGLFAMVAAVTGFTIVFRDLGLSAAVVQRDRINHHQISALFWINAAWSLALSIVVAALAPFVVWLFGKQELFWICMAMAACPLLDGLGVQHQALLTRQMRFVTLALIETSSFLAAIILGVLAAKLDWGYWSLVVMQIGRSALYTVGVWLCCNWRPGAFRRGTGIRSMVMFGGNLSVFNLIDYFCRDLDKIVVGLVGGTYWLGLYTRAFSLMQLPIQQINAPLGRVALPTLSRLADDPERFRRAYARAGSLLMRIITPLAMFSLVWGEELIVLALGADWKDTVPMFQVLALAAFVKPMGNFAGWILLSKGRADRLVRFRIATCWISPVCFVLGAWWGGAIGVAWGLVAGAFIVTPLWLTYAQKGTGIGVFNSFKPAIAPLVAALAAAAVVRFAVPLGTTLPVALVLMPLVYAALLCVLAGGLAPLRELEESIMLVIKRGPAPASESST